MGEEERVQARWLARFEEELRREQPSPERLALMIAALAYPDIDMALAMERLDSLATVVGARVAGVEMGAPRAQRFLSVITDELGFGGNEDEYYDPRNSFLNDVLERRVGLPILLSVLCMAIGRRLDLQIDGMGFPGHFMVRYVDATGAWLMDPFHGRVLEDAAAGEYLAQLFGRPVALPALGVEPVTMTALAQRILANLRGVYLNRGDYEMATRVLDYLLVMSPNDADLWQERGVLYHQLGDWERCVRDLRRYFYLTGQLAAALPEPEEIALAPLHRKERDVLRLLQEAEQMRSRWN